MKRIKWCLFNNESVLSSLSEDTSLDCHKNLKANAIKLLWRYRCYVFSRGDIHSFPDPLNLPNDLVDALKRYYSKAPKCIEYLDDEIFAIRSKLSPTVCPMCGSFSTTTVDHVFPKKDYPELAIFTTNLVPACNCNSLRGEESKDSNYGRVLHPYFDDVLFQRLYRAKFIGSLSEPKFDIEISVDDHQMSHAIAFHVKNVVGKTYVRETFSELWGQMCREYDLFPELRGKPMSKSRHRRAIESLLNRFDKEYKTPNNWKSAFVAGLVSDENAREHIRQQINGVKTGAIVPEEV